MAVFNWIASDAARSIKPSVYSAKMGDGYEQNTPTGALAPSPMRSWRS